MKTLRYLSSAILVALGLVGILDGFRLIHIMAMSAHHRRWIIIGAILFLGGLSITYFGNKKREA